MLIGTNVISKQGLACDQGLTTVQMFPLTTPNQARSLGVRPLVQSLGKFRSMVVM